MDVFKGSTSVSLLFEIIDAVTGEPKTGLVYTDVTGSYVRSGAARVAITMATLASASAAYSSGGFVAIDGTNQPGLYRLDVPNAALATGAREVVVSLLATGCRVSHRQLSLVDVNNQVAFAPNIAAGANGGLPLGNASGHVTPADASITSAKFTVAAVTGVATGILEKLDQLWRRFFRRTQYDGTYLKTYADDASTVLTTQALTKSGVTQTQGEAS